MALINCSECGHEISDKALRCPNCGCPIERVETIQEAIEVKEPKKSKTWIWGIFAFLLCIIGVGCYFYFNNYSHEEDNIGLENDFAQKIKGKYTIVVWNDNFGEFYNTEGGRLCSFELSDGRKEPMTLCLSQSLNILGKSTDRLYLSSNRLFADYSDYLNFNSSYNPNKELGVAVECSNEDDATFYFVKIGKGQIEEKHITLHQVKPKAGTDYVLLYYNDEYGTLYDRNGKRICGVSRGYSSAGDLHVKFTKTISFYNSTTNELLIKDNYVYLSSSDLIDDKYRKEGEPTTRKASSKIVDENDAVIYEFFKIDADTERAERERAEREAAEREAAERAERERAECEAANIWTGASSIEELEQKIEGTTWSTDPVKGADGLIFKFVFSNGTLKKYVTRPSRGEWTDEPEIFTYKIEKRRDGLGKMFAAICFGEGLGDGNLSRMVQHIIFTGKNCTEPVWCMYDKPVAALNFGDYKWDDEL